MKKKELIIILLALFFVTAFFFYKFFLFGQSPFPGDLLISEYSPYKYYSFLDYNPGSYPNKAQYFDVIRQLYPWKMLAIEMWKSGQIPLWNPYNFAGSPLLANNQSAVFYPLNVLFFVFKPALSWSLYIIIQPFLACLFTYLYVRRIGLKTFASLFASVAYGFSLFMSVFLEYGNYGHSFLWLPLILYSIDLYFAKNKYAGLLLAGSIACLIFAGHLQIAFAVLVISFCYACHTFLFQQHRKAKSMVLLLLFFLSGIGAASVQLFPTLELLQNSARVSHSIENIMQNFLIAPTQYILLLVPDFFGNPATRNYLLKDSYPGNALYIGILPVIFAVYALLFTKKDTYLKFFGLSIVVVLLFITQSPLAKIFYSLRLPVVSTSSPGNYIFLLSFCMAVTAGIGLDGWVKKFDKKILVPIFLVLFTFLSAFILAKILHASYIHKQLLLSFGISMVSIIAVAGLLVVKKQKAAIFLTIILCADLFYFFIKFNPFVPPALMYPRTEIGVFIQKTAGNNRVIGYKGANIDSNFATKLKIYSPEGYDPLYPKIYARYLSTKDDFSSRSDAVVSFTDNNDAPDSEKRLQTLNELSVKYILNRVENGATEHTFPPAIFQPIYTDAGWQVYENKNALPRAYVESLDGKERISADIIQNEPNKVRISLSDNQTAGRLVLSDTFYPGWKVFVDGQERSLFIANGTFRGVSVLKGDTIAEFVYKPVSFSIGLSLTIMSILIAIGASVLINKKK